MSEKSFLARNLSEFRVKLLENQQKNPKFNLAIVFAAPNFSIPALQEICIEQQISLMGCTTAGEIMDDQVAENALVCLLLEFEKNTYQVCAGDYSDASVYQTCFSIGLAARGAFATPGLLLLSGGIAVDAEQIMAGVKDGVGREIPFFGGLAGDNLDLLRTQVFTENFHSDGGAVALIVDTEAVELVGMATSGWETIGGENTVTAAQGNILVGINDEPALDFFLKHFGFFDNTFSKDGLVSTLSAQYPLQVETPSGQRVLRSPLLADFESRTLTLAAGVQVGQKFRFSIPPGFEVVEQTVQEFGELHRKVPNADAVILFSCKGRHSAFGPYIEDEIQGLYQHWKAPMVGFFSYGEIGNNAQGVCEFHNETCSLVLIRKKV